MGTGALAVLFVASVLGWACCVVAHPRLCAWLGLEGADPVGAGERELVVRRALRRLLAFNCWVLWPAALPGLALLAHSLGSGDSVMPGTVKVACGFLAFTVAVPMVVRHLRRLEGERTSPTGTPVPPSFWIEGP